MNIFLDTEFTDFYNPKLISMGMVAETGEEFYIEVPYLLKDCSEFVREAVLPLLGLIPNSACSIEQLRLQILNWLQLVRRHNEEMVICIDYETDWDLLYDALDFRVPPWCIKRIVASNIVELLRFEYHQKSRLPEHHALYDARANQYAFRESVV